MAERMKTNDESLALAVKEVENGHFSISLAGRCFNEKTERYVEADSNDYLRVSFTVDGKRHFVNLHRLVYTLFYGAIPKGLVINHIDGNKQNNSIINLEAITPAENMRHARAKGLYDTGRVSEHYAGNKGTNNPNSKLTNEQVAEIRGWFIGCGVRLQELADKYNVSYSSVRNIIKGRRYKQEMPF